MIFGLQGFKATLSRLVKSDSTHLLPVSRNLHIVNNVRPIWQVRHRRDGLVLESNPGWELLLIVFFYCGVIWVANFEFDVRFRFRTSWVTVHR